MKGQIEYFLGANSGDGFVSYFNELYLDGFRLYVLKGGPGTGKSTFMRECAAELLKRGHNIELIRCASDPGSLDAFFDYDARIAMADGTPPHVIEPKYPGAVETTVGMYEAWDVSRLEARRADIMELSASIARCHERSRDYILAAGALMRSSVKMCAGRVRANKVREIANELMSGFGGGGGGCKTRLLDAVSVGRVEFLHDTPPLVCSKLVVVEDEYGVAAPAIMAALKAKALEGGNTAIVCPSPVLPETTEHVLLPECGAGFVTSGTLVRAHYASARVISCDGLFDMGADTDELMRNKIYAAELIDEAAMCIAKAKDIHDRLEAIYVSAMDFDKLNAMRARFLNGLA